MPTGQSSLGSPLVENTSTVTLGYIKLIVKGNKQKQLQNTIERHSMRSG